MNVMISGASGLIGSALKTSLESSGHRVVRLPRTFDAPVDFNGVDAVVHLAGENIAAGRWNQAKKRRIEESRVVATRQLAEQLASSAEKPSVLICASAIGIYGNRGDEMLVEESACGTGFLPEVCQKWEAAARPAVDAGIRVVWIRTGIVLDKQGGALKKMLPPFKAALGGILGNGHQYMSWISLDDEVGAIRYLMDHESLSGVFNLTAPNPETNRDFTQALAKAIRRPAILPMPALAVRALFGEMGIELLLGSARVLPKRLVDEGYTFRHPHLESALEEIM